MFWYKKRVLPTAMEHIAWQPLSQVGLVLYQ